MASPVDALAIQLATAREAAEAARDEGRRCAFAPTPSTASSPSAPRR